MCLFVIIMNTNFLAFWKMKNWQKCFKWIKKDWWANGSSLLKGVAWINFTKNVKQFSFFNLFPISHFLILFLFIYLYLFYIGEWGEEGRRWVDGGCLMEKFTSGTIVIDLYFCIFKETVLHSAICAFDLSIDEQYNNLFYDKGHFKTSNFSIWHQTEGTKHEKKMNVLSKTENHFFRHIIYTHFMLFHAFLCFIYFLCSVRFCFCCFCFIAQQINTLIHTHI